VTIFSNGVRVSWVLVNRVVFFHMNSKNRFSLRMPGGERVGWQIVLVSILGLGLVIGPARADSVSASPTPVGSASAASPTPDGEINLEATARRRLPNTVANVVLDIQVEGRTGDAVSGALAQKSRTLLDFLRQQGVERLRTEDVSYQPQVESGRNGGPDRIVGYTGSASISFRTTPDKLGGVLSGSLDHGANTISQTQFSPQESEIDTARQDLAIEATKTALARADALAQATGLYVVRIEQINVASEENIVPVPSEKVMAGMTRPIETASGEQEVAVRVSVQVGVAKR
jgi:uncharacterized protein